MDLLHDQGEDNNENVSLGEIAFELKRQRQEAEKHANISDDQRNRVLDESVRRQRIILLLGHILAALIIAVLWGVWPPSPLWTSAHTAQTLLLLLLLFIVELFGCILVRYCVRAPC
jgi:hypothetical protein